jgi:hypothetical protein
MKSWRREFCRAFSRNSEEPCPKKYPSAANMKSRALLLLLLDLLTLGRDNNFHNNPTVRIADKSNNQIHLSKGDNKFASNFWISNEAGIRLQCLFGSWLKKFLVPAFLELICEISDFLSYFCNWLLNTSSNLNGLVDLTNFLIGKPICSAITTPLTFLIAANSKTAIAWIISKTRLILNDGSMGTSKTFVSCSQSLWILSSRKFCEETF